MIYQSLERRFEKQSHQLLGFELSMMKTLDGVDMSETVKNCHKCGDLTIQQVYISKGRMQCKPCHKTTNEKNRVKNKDRINAFIKADRKINPDKYRDRQKKYQEKYRELITKKTITRRLNLNIEVYDQMFLDQQNKCYICRKEETKISGKTGKVTKLSVDHCHKTMTVRKLLCHNCNIMIGASKDSIDTLINAVNYLKEFDDANS